uniref:Uncharacterized protein n=1 Tax=Anopheles farauti TaxID=69004 RepID=A0A182Q7A2_9DIPT
MSTKAAVAGHTFDSSSTTSIVVMKLHALPPYSSLTSIPISPLSNRARTTDGSNWCSSSIFFTSGAICSWASFATVSFITSSSSLSRFRLLGGELQLSALLFSKSDAVFRCGCIVVTPDVTVASDIFINPSAVRTTSESRSQLLRNSLLIEGRSVGFTHRI